MAKKKQKKSFAEEEMEAYATAAPDIHEDPVKLIMGVIDRNLGEITTAKLKYLDQKNYDSYGRYGDIEAAFIILKDDLRKEGFAV